MFHKRNDFEIIAVLQKGSKHLRSISKELNLPLTTAMRTTNFLIAENVIDYIERGRNKDFFLKKSPERDVYEHIVEKYKVIKVLQKPLLRTYIQRILALTRENELVVLFGSYAKSMETGTSDIDIYVETKNPILKKHISEISAKISVKIGNFEKNSDLGREIIKNHIILQNVERYLKVLYEETRFD